MVQLILGVRAGSQGKIVPQDAKKLSKMKIFWAPTIIVAYAEISQGGFASQKHYY